MLPHDLLNKLMKPKPAAPTEEPPAETETPDKADAEQNSPAPLPPTRNAGGR